ncbi:MAG: Mur ligase domain-containing protein [Elusimicrobia bacterium]|nr:Mur ligase domain-containing protein [Elusimicrobiota bacterium]
MENTGKIHFSGIGGVGMSALAQLSAMEGKPVTGSDRDFDRGRSLELKTKLRSLGIEIFPQDGSAVSPATSELIVSTAIEDSNPEIAAAKTLGVKISHRSELLASYVNRYNTIAVAGTSGKSTVVAMIFEILEFAGRRPGLITGGALISLGERGMAGNAFLGGSDLLVVEADESDGTITRYRPKTGLLLNITKDHKDLEELKNIFGVFAGNCGKFYVNADDPASVSLKTKAELFGLNTGKHKVSDISFSGFCSSFKVNGVAFKLPVPGLYNIENALAAVTVAAGLGVPLATCAAALGNYKGVDRRFRIIGEKKGITVIDDYAHNPAKVAAVLKAVHMDKNRRVIAVYQPHGFTPTRHLKNELIESFASGLAPEDILVMPEIYYAGGTANKDISSKDLTDEVSRRGIKALFFQRREEIPAAVAALMKPGGIILVMGARDATLSNFASDIFKAL